MTIPFWTIKLAYDWNTHMFLFFIKQKINFVTSWHAWYYISCSFAWKWSHPRQAHIVVNKDTYTDTLYGTKLYRLFDIADDGTLHTIVFNRSSTEHMLSRSYIQTHLLNTCMPNKSSMYDWNCIIKVHCIWIVKKYGLIV